MRLPRIASWLAVATGFLLALLAENALSFGFDDVARNAEQLAAATYKKPADTLPKELGTLSYEQYREIRYRQDNAWWRDAKLPFELGFFHRGMYYDQPVRINEINGDGVAEIKFDPSMFDYGASKIDPAKAGGLGFAGFRVHFPMNSKAKDEVVSFLGASYFRALGKDQQYGLSARALAVDTGLAGGEEFPRFVEFWVERPAAGAKELVIYGLMDSRRMTGAYRFLLRPGVETVMDVKSRLYLREPVGKLGVAPLTSMFFFGENQKAPTDDYRPEVHDSDGLLLHAANGEWIWRPLVNPKRLLVTSFATANPLGFGLMQRDRSFDHYEDLDSRYENRPSAWVEPKGAWGQGRVELVQIPSPDESNDNIVAYWVPDSPPQPKQGWDVEYRILWQKDPDSRTPQAWVAQTRRGHGYEKIPENTIGLLVEFEGAPFKKLPADTALEGVVSGDANVEIIKRHTYRNDVTGGWRIALWVKRLDNGKPAELRAHLRNGNETISETWSYILPTD
ncbi:MAG TPA: glucan biosynthesis protein G [Burkholderiales bacterium]|nr:glucan biosynthesis protein G [Burkholderiales bacterium]